MFNALKFFPFFLFLNTFKYTNYHIAQDLKKKINPLRNGSTFQGRDNIIEAKMYR